MTSSIKIAYIALITLLLFVVIGIFRDGNNAAEGGTQELKKSDSAGTNIKEETLLNYQDEELKKIVEKYLEDKDGDFAVLVKSLEPSAKEQYGYNEHKIIPSASLYKLFLLAAVYQEIEDGTLKKEQVVSRSQAHLNEILGGAEFGYDEGEGNISFTVARAMERVSQVSDNYAAIILAETVGWDALQSQADKIGARDTTIKTPITTSAYDIGLFYDKLYRGEIVSKAASDEIIELLKSAQINNRIPAEIPDDVEVAHKTGELSRIRHDAGIVYLENNPYIIVLMSENLPDENVGIKNEAELSGLIYNYFSSKD